MYMNSDSNGRGFLHASGSHSLERFVNEVEKTVTDPETKKTVWERAHLQPDPARQRTRKTGRRCGIAADLRIGALGDGSDYALVPRPSGDRSAEYRLRRRDRMAASITRSMTISTGTRTFGDPNFEYETALAQTGGDDGDAHGGCRRAAV